MICPKYKAAMLANPEWQWTPSELNEHAHVQCDRENCALWDGTRAKCSLNTDMSKVREAA